MDSSDKIISKMNEIRSAYIETNNRICKCIEDISNTFYKTNKKLHPRICKNVRENLQLRIQSMREHAVNYIQFTFNKCITVLMKQKEENSIILKNTRRFPKRVINILENSYKEEPYPTELEKTKLASLCKLSGKQINNWFTNKRNRSKMMGCIEKYDY